MDSVQRAGADLDIISFGVHCEPPWYTAQREWMDCPICQFSVAPFT